MTMNNLAVAYAMAGKLDLAIPLHEETLKLEKAKLGPDHPDTLITMSNLAVGTTPSPGSWTWPSRSTRRRSSSEGQARPRPPRHAHDHEQPRCSLLPRREADLAIPLHEETLELMKAKLGPDHPDTLATMNNLAAMYEKAGKLDLAVPLYDETLKFRQAKLGADHPDTLTTMGNLALAYTYAGKLDLAIPLQKETLKLKKTKLGPDHPGTLSTMNNLAMAYEKAGKLDLAMPLYEETLKLRKAKLGPDHPETLGHHGLARAFAVKSQAFTRAEPLLRECLAINEKARPNDWRIFDARSLLGGALLGQEKYADAEPYLRQGLRGYETAGKGDPRSERDRAPRGPRPADPARDGNEPARRSQEVAGRAGEVSPGRVPAAEEVTPGGPAHRAR